ncbi:GMC family oxidoreductase [Sinorhizobium meliloti]|uniref:GMC family oxidoreductase n=1 Tax=Rhizobium meliloti TaxID=382 RepID=UPI0006149970|nr:GMC family oxidoreductase [Sinorhizobium meliloti]KKA13143.1 GMC family oxidoreductase [Sinorhizobium meliloti]MDW9378472.1 GMC family oxidoreductase [Sinorhizobium meliloti]MDW9451875.1 GMC family oxidoreductase [Sinorhizobium meliloti]MDW9496506.1 GMC family oxidoreductase [Sinorhizobium meliloti]MDW9565132.1 GMC family oxidoreductase [Sinorhizobium meliloti]
MARNTKADVVVVGLGWAGSLIAAQLSHGGMRVVAIDRGPRIDPQTDTPLTVDPDELRWSSRKELLAKPRDNTLTMRNTLDQIAVPQRELGILELGGGAGGQGFHWAGMAWRFTPWDFQVRTETIKRYGMPRAEDGELQLQDWGLTYDDLEPDYDGWERIAGIAGKAGNLRGKVTNEGNPFEAPRSRDYPTPKLKTLRMMEIFNKATSELGLNPFTIPAANVSEAYANPLGAHLAPCTYCGFCQYHGCGNYSKSTPQTCVFPYLQKEPNFKVISKACVTRVNKAADGRTATGVTYINESGKEIEQPGDIVCLTASQMDNVRLLLVSGIGKPYDPLSSEGVVGRNFSYQTVSGADLWFEGDKINPFIGAGGLGSQIDNYNGDNFDHSSLDFIGGAGILTLSRGGAPIAKTNNLPPGTPRWGSGFKKAYSKYYQNHGVLFNQGTSMPTKHGYIDLDPTYTDRFGIPLPRLTYTYSRNDRAMAKFTKERAVEIGHQMGASHVAPFDFAQKPFTTAIGASNHTIGGAVMGADRSTSAVNSYLQAWDCPNAFVIGASAFPNNAGYNPTGTVGALALRAARAILEKYVRHPGELIED